MNPRILFFCLVIFCLNTASVKGFKHLDTHNGLSNKRTFSIEKDRAGFMWISTRVGVDRYDGRYIKQYKLLDENSKDIAGRINMLAKDCNDNLWVYTNNGQIFQYDIDRDAYTLRINLPEKIPDENIFLNGIYFTRDNHLFILGSFGLLLYLPESGQIREIEPYKQYNIFSMKEIGTSKYAVGTQEDLFISEISVKDGGVSCREIFPVHLRERVQCMYFEEFNNTLLIGTFSGKLLMYDIFRKKLSDTRYDFGESVRDIESYNNTFFIATDGIGVIRINKDNKKIQESYSHFKDEKMADPPYSIYNLLIDDNRLWIATYSNGIYIYDDNLPMFKPIRPEKQTRNPNHSVDALLEDRDGNIWYGTNDGVSKYNVYTGQWQHVLESAGTNNKKYNTLALCEDDAGRIWAGGASAVCINPVSMQIDKYLQIPNTSGIARPYTIFNDSEGMIWLGGLYFPLTKYNTHTQTFKQYKVKSVNTIVETNNTLMAGTAQGLYILDKNADAFVEFLSVKRTASTMQSFINAIYEDSQGILWLGTEGGLLKYDRKRDLLDVHTKDNGLPSNSLYSILSDKRNRLWISTESGLSCYDPVSMEFINFGVEEGLVDERFKARSFLKKRNGELMYGTTGGAVCFTPEVIDRVNTKHKLFMTELSILYQPVYPHEKNSPLKTTLENTGRIRLKYYQNTFSFEFTSINYTNPHASRFEWRLKSYDKEWINQKDINTAFYTNVPPGRYTFEIRLVNKDNLNVIDSKSIDVEIAPPFWETIGAKIIYLLLLSGLGWIIIQFFRAKMEKRGVSEKMEFFTHTAHELKTPVTLIKGPLEKLRENDHYWGEDDKILLNLAVKNTNRLYKLVTQMLDFQKTAKSFVKLTLSKHDLNEYMKDRLELFQPSARKKDIRITLTAGASIPVWIDVEKTDKIIGNLLSNAIKYTPERGSIDVSLSSDNKYWRIQIKDSGIGIPKKNQKDIFKPFFRAKNAVNSSENGTGIGLLLTKNLIRLHHGDISFDSVEGKGSIFTLTFPCGKSHFDVDKCIFLEDETPEEYHSDIEASTVVEISGNDKTTIVVVEDSPDMRTLLKQELKDKYTVLEASNGEEAVRMIKKSDIELIISDVMMPGIDGYELCTRIKSDKETSHIPIILLTVLDDVENVHKGYLLGADNYITKPFDPAILRMTVENTIATRQALRKNLVLPLEQDDVPEELDTNPLDKAFIEEVIAIIDKNINDSELSIDEICREVAMSRSSFFKKLKILTNQGPNNFIRTVRLNRAAKMLREKKYTIAEVAYSTGFNDVKYFSTIFKKHFGINPGKYEN
ncbi:MAG: response regulator [Candidatus Azobacteroides sp.]|nr:response regulator [Candidatus Azobacteroides sp.]